MKSVFIAPMSALLLVTSTSAEEFGGIEFPQGSVSFADRVVAYNPGTPAPTAPNFVDPTGALGAPDYPGGDDQPGSVSLGSGGSIILEFTNNLLTGSDDEADDLHVFEVGSDVEDTFVEISKDGILWEAIGKVFGSTSSIDLDALGFSSADHFRFVRLTDDPDEGQQSGDTVGADIDAVGAINTEPVVDTPDLMIETAVLVQFQSALGSQYTIQSSVDLENWSDVIVDITGTGDVIRRFFEITTPETFYRLKPLAE